MFILIQLINIGCSVTSLPIVGTIIDDKRKAELKAKDKDRDEYIINKIRPGFTTEEEIIKNLGNPSKMKGNIYTYDLGCYSRGGSEFNVSGGITLGRTTMYGRELCIIFDHNKIVTSSEILFFRFDESLNSWKQISLEEWIKQ